MAKVHSLGFPRIGKNRELKFLLEKYWGGEISESDLLKQSSEIRRENWLNQSELDFITVGDFSFYDHVLDLSQLFGNLPKRSNFVASKIDQYFSVARGRGADQSFKIRAGEMTKWFDTNYHYIVPEFDVDTSFKLDPEFLLSQIEEAKEFDKPIKVVLVGPITYLWLGKSQDNSDVLQLLPDLVTEYNQLLSLLSEKGVQWVQFDESALVTDLDSSWKEAFLQAYTLLECGSLKILLATYFGKLSENAFLLPSLKVDGFHLDCVRGLSDLDGVFSNLGHSQVLSLGVVDGRNIWLSDLNQILDLIDDYSEILGDRLWISSSCSLLHVPVDLSTEINIDSEIMPWLSFAKQKISEITLLRDALENRDSYDSVLEHNKLIINQRKQSIRIHDASIKKKIDLVRSHSGYRKSKFNYRKLLQDKRLILPKFPTTTIGSFPQTANIRSKRKQYKLNNITYEDYVEYIQKEIRFCIEKQEKIGLDVLVHGEPERNDMVEYFGEHLGGFLFTQYGWVQSYGSRCVKPPIIYGDVSRSNPITIEWIQYAQSLTHKPVKGMLTGPVTILNWSFVRDDQPRSETSLQLAVALKEEVEDLETASVPIIQIDEAALREGLPLRQSEWKDYLDWAIKSFRIMASGVNEETQIHTHMCYSDFNDIITSILEMDADVITIETSRSNMELLDTFKEFDYTNDIGPGVYDIHSPNIPTREDIVSLIKKATQFIPGERLWVNPDCGLKTRSWNEVEPALSILVDAAKTLRKG